MMSFVSKKPQKEKNLPARKFGRGAMPLARKKKTLHALR